MTDVSIRQLNGPDPLLDQVEPLLIELYESMMNDGLLLPLAPDGAKKWRKGVEAVLGRWGTLMVATRGDRVVGFLYGTLRLTPDYLGSEKVGYLGHGYVAPGFRRQGIAQAMYAQLEDWFRSKSVGSVEAQVLWRNVGSMAVWERAGFQRELVQIRKVLK